MILMHMVRRHTLIIFAPFVSTILVTDRGRAILLLMTDKHCIILERLTLELHNSQVRYQSMNERIPLITIIIIVVNKMSVLIKI